MNQIMGLQVTKFYENYQKLSFIIPIYILNFKVIEISHLLVVVSSSQRLQTIRGKLATGRVEFLSVILGQFSSCITGSHEGWGERECDLPKLLMVMMNALLSASNPRTSHMTSAVSPPMFLQKL